MYIENGIFRIMKYKASYDIITKVLSVLIVVALLTAIGKVISYYMNGELVGPGWVICILVAFVIAVLLGSWLYSPQHYILTEDTLVVKRPARDIVINLSDISGVSPKDSLPMLRLLGVGGLFGYYGLYCSNDLGRMYAYCTQQNHLVFIKTQKGYPIIISPDEDLLFMADLRAKLK